MTLHNCTFLSQEISSCKVGSKSALYLQNCSVLPCDIPFLEFVSCDEPLNLGLNHNKAFRFSFVLFPCLVTSPNSLDVHCKALLTINEEHVGVPPFVHVYLD